MMKQPYILKYRFSKGIPSSVIDAMMHSITSFTVERVVTLEGEVLFIAVGHKWSMQQAFELGILLSAQEQHLLADYNVNRL